MEEDKDKGTLILNTIISTTNNNNNNNNNKGSNNNNCYFVANEPPRDPCKLKRKYNESLQWRHIKSCQCPIDKPTSKERHESKTSESRNCHDPNDTTTSTIECHRCHDRKSSERHEKFDSGEYYRYCESCQVNSENHDDVMKKSSERDDDDDILLMILDEVLSKNVKRVEREIRETADDLKKAIDLSRDYLLDQINIIKMEIISRFIIHNQSNHFYVNPTSSVFTTTTCRCRRSVIDHDVAMTTCEQKSSQVEVPTSSNFTMVTDDSTIPMATDLAELMVSDFTMATDDTDLTISDEHAVTSDGDHNTSTHVTVELVPDRLMKNFRNISALGEIRFTPCENLKRPAADSMNFIGHLTTSDKNHEIISEENASRNSSDSSDSDISGSCILDELIGENSDKGTRVRPHPVNNSGIGLSADKDIAEPHRVNENLLAAIAHLPGDQILCGMALIYDDLYVIRNLCSSIEIYDVTNLPQYDADLNDKSDVRKPEMIKRRLLKIRLLRDPVDVASFHMDRCLYVSASDDTAIFKVTADAPAGYRVHRWPMKTKPFGVSVVPMTGRVLVTFPEEVVLREFTPEGIEVRMIRLDREEMDFPWHAVVCDGGAVGQEVEEERILVCHGWTKKAQSTHLSLIRSIDGRVITCHRPSTATATATETGNGNETVIKTEIGIVFGSGTEKENGNGFGFLNLPTHIAQDSSGSALVADLYGHRIHRFRLPGLKFVESVLGPNDGLHWPRCLAIDKERDRVYVGLHEGTILIFQQQQQR